MRSVRCCCTRRTASTWRVMMRSGVDGPSGRQMSSRRTLRCHAIALGVVLGCASIEDLTELAGIPLSLAALRLQLLPSAAEDGTDALERTNAAIVLSVE